MNPGLIALLTTDRLTELERFALSTWAFGDARRSDARDAVRACTAAPAILPAHATDSTELVGFAVSEVAGYVHLELPEVAPVPEISSTPSFVLAWGSVVSHTAFETPTDSRSPAPITRIAVLKRKAALSPSEFWDHWKTVHAPLVVASEPLFQRYVLNYNVDSHAQWDGIVEQAFSSVEAANEHDSRIRGEGRELVKDDISRFVMGAWNFHVS